MFYMHERGFYIGLYAWAVTNGAHLGPVIGGYLVEGTSYRWAWYFPAIVQSGVFIANIFFLPETLFSRRQNSTHKVRTNMQLLFDWKGNTLRDRSVTLYDYFHCFYMLKYPSVTFSLIHYSIAFTLGTVTPAVSVASVFNRLYGWNTGLIGLGLGIPLLIGSLLAESCTGWVVDYALYRYAKKHNGYQLPESRLYVGVISAFIGPIGIILYGCGIQQHWSWIALCVTLALMSFGLQACTTIIYSYVSDCYKAQASESAAVINTARMTLAFTTGFWFLAFGNSIGFDKSCGILGAIWFARSLTHGVACL